MGVFHSNGMVQAFCWLCGASTGRSHTWETISGHSCGRYKEDADKKINEAQRYSSNGCCHSLPEMQYVYSSASLWKILQATPVY